MADSMQLQLALNLPAEKKKERLRRWLLLRSSRKKKEEKELKGKGISC